MSEKIIIKRGEKTIVVIEREVFGTFDETPDGIVFNLKDKSFYTVIDSMLPTEVKVKIKHGIENYKKGNLIIDLVNHAKPIRVQL